MQFGGVLIFIEKTRGMVTYFSGNAALRWIDRNQVDVPIPVYYQIGVTSAWTSWVHGEHDERKKTLLTHVLPFSVS